MNTVRSIDRPTATMPPAQRGFTIVELMVALVLGLVLVGGVINVFVTSGQTTRVHRSE